MSEPSAHTFACLGCGRQILWNARIAGKVVKCTCGAHITVPHGSEEDVYDLADEPLLEELPSAVTRKAVPPATLGYESAEKRPDVRNDNRGVMTVKDLVIETKNAGLLVPLLILAGAVGARYALSALVGSGTMDGGAGIGLVALAMLLNAGAMLAGVGAVARFTGADMGSLPATTVKLCAVGVFGSALMALTASIDHGDGLQGMVIGFHVMLLFNWIMFSILFEFDIQEALFSVALTGILQALGAFALAQF